MGIRSLLSKPFASYIVAEQKKWSLNPFSSQSDIFRHLVQVGRMTEFGKDHSFMDIHNYEDFKKHVPIRDYEGLSPYIKKVIAGQLNVLWKDLPLYFAKTSGTTSGVKYIPITKDSIPNHINSARDALLNYVNESKNSQFLDGKLIFLSGSPTLDKKGAVPTGRLSGIVNHHVPRYLKGNQLPSFQTNIMEDWEEKLEKVIDETIDQDMTLISGIPPWVQMYFDRIQSRTGKKIKDVFPNFSVFVYGGVNFEPYRAKLFDSIGKKVDSIETFPASEGFFAYQNSQHEEGLLLLVNSGIFFEFIPLDEYFKENPKRLCLEEVELGVNYALVINNNAGLWGYSIGDTVKFISKKPYKLLVTGRVKHFISAFGEHVIGEEVEKAMKETMSKFKEAEVVEFTVVPNVTPREGLPHHEWLVEFAKTPNDLEAFAKDLNINLQRLNTYYNDLISGNILTNLKITPLKRDAFREMMKAKGKLGGQNKVPRLSNDRTLAEELLPFKN